MSKINLLKNTIPYSPAFEAANLALGINLIATMILVHSPVHLSEKFPEFAPVVASVPEFGLGTYYAIMITSKEQWVDLIDRGVFDYIDSKFIFSTPITDNKESGTKSLFGTNIDDSVEREEAEFNYGDFLDEVTFVKESPLLIDALISSHIPFIISNGVVCVAVDRLARITETAFSIITALTAPAVPDEGQEELQAVS